MAEKAPFTLNMHHTGVFVSDMEKSIEWYEEMLGFTLAHRNIFELPNQGKVDMAWLKNGNFYIELYQYAQPLKPFDLENYFGNLGTKHICLSVPGDEFLELKEHLNSKGAKVIIDIRWPLDQRVGPIKPLATDADPETSHGVLYVVDPDGIWIEVVEDYTPGKPTKK